MRHFVLLAICGVVATMSTPLPAQDGHSNHDTTQATSGPRTACRSASFSPEVITFYGDSKAVQEKLDSYQAHLEDRRVYMFVAETANSAEAMLFETSGDTNVHVSHWRGTSVSELCEQISTKVLANRGIACVGEQVKSLVLKALPTDDLGVIPAPVTMRAAFGHNVKAYGNDYMRVTVYLLC